MKSRPNLTQLFKEIEEDEYIEESRCVRCDQEISWDEDMNNLGMCNYCHKQSILFSYEQVSYV